MGDVILFGAIRSKITKPGGALIKEQGGGGSARDWSRAQSTGGRPSGWSDVVRSSGWSDTVGVVVEVSAVFVVAVIVEKVGIVAVQKQTDDEVDVSVGISEVGGI
jgi:hypothetical protein